LLHSKLRFFSLTAFTGAALFSMGVGATVHPTGTLLDDWCGIVTRSETICVATVVGSKNQYIVVKHFKTGEVAILAKSTTSGLLKTFEGVGIPVDNKGVRGLETKYELKLRTSPKATYGTWSLNGKAVGPEFPMEQVFHIQ
jgi:hypothetical protein